MVKLKDAIRLLKVTWPNICLQVFTTDSSVCFFQPLRQTAPANELYTSMCNIPAWLYEIYINADGNLIDCRIPAFPGTFYTLFPGSGSAIFRPGMWPRRTHLVSKEDWEGSVFRDRESWKFVKEGLPIWALCFRDSFICDLLEFETDLIWSCILLGHRCLSNASSSIPQSCHWS